MDHDSTDDEKPAPVRPPGGFIGLPETPCRFPITIALLGARAVGKSAIAARFLTGRFRHSYSPTQHRVHDPLPLCVDGVDYDLCIVDTDGQREESRFGLHYTLGIDGFLLVFAVDDASSFGLAKRINCRLLSALAITVPEEIPRLLVGNKTDRNNRLISTDDAERLARYIKCPYAETSAARDEGCIDVLRNIVRMVRDARLAPMTREDNGKDRGKEEGDTQKEARSACVLL